MTLGPGYRYLMESVAAGDGERRQSTSLSDYYAESGTPPGVFLGAGLGSLDDGRGVEKGSAVSEEHLFNMLGMCADPVTGQALGRQPNRAHLSMDKRLAERMKTTASSVGAADRAEAVRLIEPGRRLLGLFHVMRHGGLAGCVKSRPSRPIETAGTSRGRIPSAARATS
jgi:hypothetical protein